MRDSPLMRINEVTSEDTNWMKLIRKRSWKRSVKREKKTNKMQKLDVYYQLLSQHVSDIIMPIFRRTKAVLLHLVYCSGSAGCGW